MELPGVVDWFLMIEEREAPPQWVMGTWKDEVTLRATMAIQAPRELKPGASKALRSIVDLPAGVRCHVFGFTFSGVRLQAVRGF